MVALKSYTGELFGVKNGRLNHVVLGVKRTITDEFQLYIYMDDLSRNFEIIFG